ncbi:hypothetical protein ACIBEK_28960 [Nocardia fusca]|uniref:hypothetical protein n=1 Tax=Nocardia fusca TaxID=941183 RepID=UPI0037A4E0EF
MSNIECDPRARQNYNKSQRRPTPPTQLRLPWLTGLDRRPGATRDEFRIAIVTWMERTYHRRLGRIPIEWETMMTTPAVQAT